MDSTLEVLMFPKFIVSNLIESINKLSIFLTFEKSKLDKSIDFNLWHLVNAPAIFSKESVLIFPKVIFSKLEQP